MENTPFFQVKNVFCWVAILAIACSFPLQGFANSKSPVAVKSKASLTEQLVLNSHSFHAKTKSNFLVGEIQEHVGRGLTIVHLRTETDFEYRTFDTYGSKTAAAEFVEILGKLQKNRASYAILAHDSAAGTLTAFSSTITTMGFPILGTLKNRQAYVMHNLNGKIDESVHELSINTTLAIPKNIQHAQEYFPKIKYEFEPNIDRYIAHAGGAVDGIKSTNSLEALNQNYKRGFRLFELDIVETKDGKLVAAHDWKMWSRFTDYKGTLPVTHAEFKKHKIYGKYTTIDMEGINKWFAAHPDAILFTDKVNDPIAFANGFVDKNRLVMELFSLMAVEEASKSGIKAMISQVPLGKIKGDKLAYLSANNVRYVALSRRVIANQTALLLDLRKAGIRVYVYNVNFDPGKDEKYVQENELGLVYGMYADKWVFDQNIKEVSK